MGPKVPGAAALTLSSIVAACPAPPPVAPVDAAVPRHDTNSPPDLATADHDDVGDAEDSISRDASIDVSAAADSVFSDVGSDAVDDDIDVADAMRDAIAEDTVRWEMPDGSLPTDPAIQVVKDTNGGCILARSGAVWCWGALRPGRTRSIEPSVPERAQTLPPSRELHRATSNVMVLDREGVVWQWFQTARCERTTFVPSPLPFPSVGNIRRFADEGLAVFEDGSCRLYPMSSDCLWETQWFRDVVSASSYYSVRCAALSSGLLSCYLAYPGQPVLRARARWMFATIGDGPTVFPGLSDVVDVRVGAESQCVLHRSGEVRCWGSAGRGESGSTGELWYCDDQDFQEWNRYCRRTPTLVPGISDALSLATPTSASYCVLRRDRTVWCWGYLGRSFGWENARFGAEGDLRNALLEPARIAGLRDVVSFDADGGGWCAVIRDGRVFCKGYNPGNGQAHSGDTPVEVRWE